MINTLNDKLNTLVITNKNDVVIKIGSPNNNRNNKRNTLFCQIKPYFL